MKHFQRICITSCLDSIMTPPPSKPSGCSAHGGCELLLMLNQISVQSLNLQARFPSLAIGGFHIVGPPQWVGGRGSPKSRRKERGCVNSVYDDMTGGGPKVRKFCGCHIWKPPYHNLYENGITLRSKTPRRIQNSADGAGKRRT